MTRLKAEEERLLAIQERNATQLQETQALMQTANEQSGNNKFFFPVKRARSKARTDTPERDAAAPEAVRDEPADPGPAVEEESQGGVNLAYQAQGPNQIGNLAEVEEEEDEPWRDMEMAPLDSGSPLPLKAFAQSSAYNQATKTPKVSVAFRSGENTCSSVLSAGG